MFVLVNKPTWCTSFDVVKKLKRLYRWEKIWHAGTLDPLATWLLIIAIGKDTKKLSTFVGLDKTYTATINFALKSDTRDTDYWEYYEELDVNTLQVPTQTAIEDTLASIVWYHALPLTPFSAKKRKGKKLYEYARAGEPIFINIDMQVLSFRVVSYTFPELILEIRVWSWTYIRSIAHWLWEQFGLGWILTALHRSHVWSYTLDTNEKTTQT